MTSKGKAVTDPSRLTGPEKAAIVLLTLGEDHKVIWRALDDEEIKEISQAMAGLGNVSSTVVEQLLVEFVSKGKRNWHRDYIEKRDEYMAIGVKEYWIIDRFERTLTVHSAQGKRIKKRVVTEKDTYTTPLLPGFELPLAGLLALADQWSA